MMVVDDLTDELVLSFIQDSKHFRELEKDKKVSKITTTVLSEEGYLSVVYNAVITFSDETQFSFIIKRISVARYLKSFSLAEEKSNLELLANYHNRECQVYELLSKTSTVAPRLYAAKPAIDVSKDPGYILMESFVGRASVLGVFTATTDQHCLNVARQLGKLRAEVAAVPFEEYSDWNDPFRIDADMVQSLLDQHLQSLLDYDNELFAPLVEKLKPYANRNSYNYLLKTRAVELGVASLTHADLHGSNMIAKLQPDGTPSNEIVAFIDWQTSFCGNSLFDLARFLSFSDADTRRRVEQDALDEYYNTYLEFTKKPNPKFTREVCQELYDLGLLMEALEWQNLFGIVFQNFTCNNEKEKEAFKARMAVKARFTMEDGIQAIEKYNLKDRLANLQNGYQ
ncbi:unnamed protein product [Bursaphelenchus xylophilus]|uniref:(pine wood nematode) hypothetical protein n=1 Tax=Bursaphelenchus xylophilus TaxID=6326 RepID=A0A1I7S4V4_BURXY|nr:unnamed protein product [Bursaphelenchus xylophilus]CAG9117401.1 unnamed protein product [Bursaphelenchus xylophilus]